MPSTVRLPSLPQHVTPAEREAREFQLSLARTEYNYMRSYLEGVPMSADLLSGVQYDTFGHYEHNPRDPYFNDPRIQPLVSEFQSELALIEIEIRKRNATRPVVYPFQLPSMIPNSISI